eukprot:3610104-Amphidinium_carterae.2
MRLTHAGGSTDHLRSVDWVDFRWFEVWHDSAADQGVIESCLTPRSSKRATHPTGAAPGGGSYSSRHCKATERHA